jgi:type IV pilus assembly protein PilM
MKNPFAKQVMPLGLDIGKHAVKGIRLKRNQERVLLDQYFYDSSGSFSKTSPTELQSQLGALVEINELQNSPTCSSVSESEVLNFSFTIPAIPDEEMIPVVRNEIERRLHYPIEEATFDYTTQPFAIEGQSKYIVNAYCAKKEFIEEHLTLLQKSRLAPLSIEGQLLANVATLEFNEYLPNLSATYAIVDLGQSHTTLGLVTAGQLNFSNRLEVGTLHLLQEIAELQKISLEEAEQKNSNHYLSLASSDLNFSPLDLCINEFYRGLIVLMQSSLAMLFEQAVGSTVEKVYLLGGGSQKKNLGELFQRNTGLRMEIPNPLKNIDIYHDEKIDSRIANFGAHFNVAVGLAVREF